MSKAECGDIAGLVRWDGIREDLQAGIRDHSPRMPYQRQSESPLLIARLRISPSTTLYCRRAFNPYFVYRNVVFYCFYGDMVSPSARGR